MFGFWCFLLLRANHKKGWFFGHPIEPGQFATSYGSLADQTGATVMQCRTFLEKLAGFKMIKRENIANRFTIISICNWSTYQLSLNDEQQTNDTTNNKLVTNQQQADNKLITTIKECKKENNDKNDKKKPLMIPDHLLEIWPYYLEMRKLIKKPATDNAQESTIKKLEKLAPGNNQLQIEIIQQSIDQSWQGVFELKNQCSLNQRKKYEYERGTETKYNNLQTASNSDD